MTTMMKTSLRIGLLAGFLVSAAASAQTYRKPVFSAPLPRAKKLPGGLDKHYSSTRLAALSQSISLQCDLQGWQFRLDNTLVEGLDVHVELSPSVEPNRVDCLRRTLEGRELISDLPDGGGIAPGTMLPKAASSGPVQPLGIAPKPGG